MTLPRTSRATTWALDRGGLLALAVLVLYLWTAPDHIVGGDNAEFITAANIGGVPHPTGYPLHILWLRAMSWLPAHNAAHAASMAVAILGALTALALHAACRAWGARPLAASLTVAIFAAGPVIIRQSTEAEVFTLNMLVVATIVWLAANAGPLRGIWRAVALALVAGLGMTNHVTCVLIAPVGILGVVRAVRETERGRAVVPVAAAGAFVVGLLPYAYLFLTKTTAISWRSIDSLGDLIHHILRMDYGGPGAFSPGRVPVSVGDNVTTYAEMLARGWLLLPLLVGIVALGARCIRPAGETRWGWWMFALSFLLAGPLLILRFNVPVVSVGTAIVHRFHMMSAMLLAIPVAAGLDWIGSQIAMRRPIAIRPWIGGAVAIVVFLAAALRSLPSHSLASDRCASNILRSLPQNAVLITAEDYMFFGSMYRQLVEGDRPDVTVIAWGQLLNPGYRARLTARSGLTPEIPADKKVSITIALDAFAKGRSVFADPSQMNLIKTFPTYPYGILLRVLPVGTKLPDPRELLAINKTVFENYRFDYPIPDRDDDYAAHIHDRYAQAWKVIARALASIGAREDAAFALNMATVLRP